MDIITAYNLGLRDEDYAYDLSDEPLNKQQVLLAYYTHGIVSRIRLTEISKPTPPPDAPAIEKPNTRLADPEFFKGEKTCFKTFLSQIHMKIRADPAFFTTEERKIFYTASFLRNEAYVWYYI